MNRHTSNYGDQMIFGAWLTLNPNGSMALNRSEPSLSPGERAVKLSVKVPKSLFKLPQINAIIELPKGSQAGEIQAETIAALESTIKAGLGMNISITVGEE